MRAGQVRRQLDLDEGGRGGLHSSREDRAPLWRRRRGDGLRRAGPGRHHRAQDCDLRTRLRHPGQQGRLSAGGHHLRSEYLRGRDRDRGAQQLRRRLHRGGALHPREAPACACFGRRVQPVLLVPRQRAGARGDASVFLYHAIQAGMDMGIVNAAQMAVYDDLDAELREACEDVVLNRREDAAERLLDIAKRFFGQPAKRPRPISPGAGGRSASGCRMRSSTALPISSRWIPRRRGRPPSVRST